MVHKEQFINNIAAHGERIVFDKGKTFYRSGQEATTLVVVYKGDLDTFET